MTFNLDELNQHAIDRAREMLGVAAEPVAEERRCEVAEAVVTDLQDLQERHGMRQMLRMAEGYESREPLRRHMWNALGVTGPQVDAAIQAAARVLWNEA